MAVWLPPTVRPSGPTPIWTPAADSPVTVNRDDRRGAPSVPYVTDACDTACPITMSPTRRFVAVDSAVATTDPPSPGATAAIERIDPAAPSGAPAAASAADRLSSLAASSL